MSGRKLRILLASFCLRSDNVFLFINTEWRARANQVAIAVDIIDTRNSGPELEGGTVFLPRCWEGSHLTRVRAIPLLSHDYVGCVGGKMERGVNVCHATFLNLSNLFANRDQGVYEAI